MTCVKHVILAKLLSLQADPLTSIELDLIWDQLPLTPGATHPQLRPAAAARWELHALERGYGQAEAQGFGLRTAERYRQARM